MQGRDSRRRCLGGGGRQKHYKDLDDGGAAVSNRIVLRDRGRTIPFLFPVSGVESVQHWLATHFAHLQ